jgi:hypothetical protein
MRDHYISCYILGRTDTFDGEVDMDGLVERILDGAPMRETSLEVARRAVMASADSSAKVEWLHENLEAVRSLGGDTEKAWRLFSQGRVDALAAQVEESALEDMIGRLDEDEAGAEDEEDETEEDETEEGEEEDEDEDEDDGK